MKKCAYKSVHTVSMYISNLIYRPIIVLCYFRIVTLLTQEQALVYFRLKS